MKKLKIFPKTFLYTLSLMLIIVLLSHALIYFLMPWAYNYQQEKALETDTARLVEQITTTSPGERLNCVMDFATKWTANVSVEYDGFSYHMDEKHIRGINHALAVSIGLIEPVPPKLTLYLCGACADAFRGTGAFALREAVPGQAEKEVCVYCGQRPGMEYVVTPKGGARV